MFCPQCKAEYKEGFTRCVDCDVPLVPALPAQSEQLEGASVELVTVLTTIDFPLLTVVKSILESADIPFITRGEEVLSVFPGLPMGRASGDEGGIVAIQVPKDRAAEAEELLQQIEENNISDLDEDE